LKKQAVDRPSLGNVWGRTRPCGTDNDGGLDTDVYRR
jgi:hypothetical protein